MNFNVGDKVRVIKNIGGHGFRIGDIVEIFQESPQNIAYKCKSNSSISMWMCLKEELELVQRGPNTKGFKVGDRVRISKQCDLHFGDWKRNFGVEGTITIVDFGEYSVDFDNGDCSACFHEKDLELINNKSSNQDDKTTMKKVIKSFPYGINKAYRNKEIKVGDRVRIKDSSGCWRSYPAFITLTKIGSGGVEWRGGACSCSDLDRPFDMEVEIDDTPIKISENSLDKVVLPKETKEEIIAVLKQHQHQDKIFKDWGLGETIEYGKGMTFLFYGTPGTGKTWCATQMAKLMNRELLVLSPAEVQSQEPGGANRAIQQAFKTAKEQNKLILLDECDSLITERGDVGMILGSEINTLLTEIEKFEGICVLTTNRIDTLDEALERRISLIVEFQEPDFETREKLWDKLLPKKMPLGNNVKIKDLSQYKLTGGQIKNVILQAARLAVANDEEKVDYKYFEIAILRIVKSKNLMGNASRYNQIKVKGDLGMSDGIKRIVRKSVEKVGA